MNTCDGAQLIDLITAIGSQHSLAMRHYVAGLSRTPEFTGCAQRTILLCSLIHWYGTAPIVSAGCFASSSGCVFNTRTARAQEDEGRQCGDR